MSSGYTFFFKFYFTVKCRLGNLIAKEFTWHF